ncbi:hypothetical protein NZ698_03355 [Chryseobacterium sp. PBS4-4]|uniref:Uncharacterized protein n=1 Tax=Chryseobacterium edaphi TaxID=2976532 RepID=A0ABT2W1W5_9FLAO|nr:hypothetical protein [Chryseobacterium edaphi]MCU7616222.1 hypothetical protein [Chryseobacterium edaphi]
MTGKPIRFQQVSNDDYIKTLLEQHHTSEAFAVSLTEMLKAIGNGLYDTEPRTNYTLTTIKVWMRENVVNKIRSGTNIETFNWHWKLSFLSISF